MTPNDPSDLWPHTFWDHMCYSIKGSYVTYDPFVQVIQNTSKYVDIVTPYMIFDLISVEVTIYVALLRDHCVQIPWKYIKVYGHSNHFSNHEPKVQWPKMTSRWALTTLLLSLPVRFYPRINRFKSHGSTSKYVDIVTKATIHLTCTACGASR